MRNLTQHIVEGDSANHQLTVGVEDQPGSGGANHLYRITGFNSESNPSDPWTASHGAPGQHSTILFQNGPIKEFGVNGVTHEVLLAILVDRMEGFQAGPFASDDNAIALNHMKAALGSLQKRTRARILRGVEGTHTV
jgi:hypothetical protein